jgi:hypothetical protein
VSHGIVWVVRIVRPSIDRFDFGMTVEREDFHDPVPYGFPVERPFYGNALTMRSFRTVEFVNDGLEVVYVAHTVMSLVIAYSAVTLLA